MAKHIAIALMLSGLVLGFRGLHVWTDCGYDCAALSYPYLTATGAILVALLVAAAGLGTLIVVLLGGPSKRS